jgi:hypothetical protein
MIIDDGAVAALGHALHHRVQHVHHARRVDRDHIVPLDRILLEHVGKVRDAGVIDDAVDGPKTRFGLSDGLCDRRAVSDINGAAQRVRQIERFHALEAPGEQQQRIADARERHKRDLADLGCYQARNDHGG